MFNLKKAKQTLTATDENGNTVQIKRFDLKGEYPIIGITLVNGSAIKSELYTNEGLGRDGMQLECE